MEEKVEKLEKRDRMLGDEWENWTGDLDESKEYNETAALFTWYAGIALAVTLLFFAFVLYMIEPRLELIHPAVLFTARIATAVIILLSAGWSVLMAVSVFTGKNLIFHTRTGQVTAARFLPFAIAAGRRLGISRDRIGNSFVSFSNAIVRATYKPDSGKTIILLPRCLKSDLKQEVRELAARADVEVFTATGGGQARKIIREQRPSAVIGVACERDLMSGINDVAPKMPTMGVTNKRPEGPCKNTLIDLNELKKAIETFTGKSLD